MNLRRILVGVAFGAAAPLLLAQSNAQTNTTQTTTTAATTAENTVTGEVVTYTSGQTIAIRQADGQTVTYTLSPDVAVPAEVQVGKTVTISTRADDTGSARVTRVVIAAAPASGSSTSSTTSSSTSMETTTQSPEATGNKPMGSSEAAAPSAGTVTGEVVRYEAGKTIVVRGTSGKETSYALSESSQVPAEVRVGRRVTLTTEPSDSGTLLVTRVTTESILPDGRRKTTTESTYRKASGEAGASRMTSIAGTVTAYAPGQSITVVLPDKTTATYTIDAESQLPSDVAVGKQVTVQTRTVTTGTSPVVRRVVYTTKTKTTTKKTESPQ